MQGVKKIVTHVSSIIRGMLFIGFSAQILSGLAWMCGNFGEVQDFGAPGPALYGGLARLSGGIPQLLYLVQALAAFWVGYYFLEKLRPSGRDVKGRLWAVWRALALLTFPFAMQCHLALLPCSFMNSLFLLMLSFVLQAVGGTGTREPWDVGEGEPTEQEIGRKVSPREQEIGREVSPREQEIGQITPGGCREEGREWGRVQKPTGKKRASWDRFRPNPLAGRRHALVCLAAALLCGAGMAVLSGVGDTARREGAGGSMEAALASRFAWPTLWIDHSTWDDDLLEIAGDVVWEASFSPGNMQLLEAAIEENVPPETAKAYYVQIAQTGWEAHAPMVIRQIAWDVLGYALTPVIVPLQLRGGAYDSYTGRNYEIMCGSTPVLTRNYVDYSCWWFAVSCIMTLVSLVLELAKGKKIFHRRRVVSVLVCLFFAGLLVGGLAMRGAGMMDYKYTAAVNQLWLVPALLPKGRGAPKASGKPLV